MRITDWMSDVCSSDLLGPFPAPAIRLKLDVQRGRLRRAAQLEQRRRRALGRLGYRHRILGGLAGLDDLERKSVVEGKRVVVREDLGVRRTLKIKTTKSSIEPQNCTIQPIHKHE